MAQPHYDAGNIIATDARIMIVAPEKYFDAAYAALTGFPNYKYVLDKFSNMECAWLPVAECIKIVNDLTLEPVYAECVVCGGEGEHECSCGDTHDCQMCDGSGESEIEIGKKINHYKHALGIGEAMLNPNLVKTAMKVAVELGLDRVGVAVSEILVMFVMDDIKIVMAQLDKERFNGEGHAI